MEDYCSIAGLAAVGRDEKEIARALGISVRALHTLAKNDVQYANALRRNPAQAGGEIMYAALQQAMGFTKTVTKPVKVKRIIYFENGKKKEEIESVEMVEEERYIPPSASTTALLLRVLLPDIFGETDPDEAGPVELIHQVDRP